ncbi:MAG: hypothetical protein GKR77_04450 [Legionellales bacterium]|nr:hypothetical protein [Legionellales bacterium]
MNARLTVTLGTNTEQFEADFFPFSTRVKALTTDAAWLKITEIQVDQVHGKLTLLEVFGENLQRIAEEAASQVLSSTSHRLFDKAEEKLSDDDAQNHIKQQLQDCPSLLREVFISTIQWSIIQHQQGRIMLEHFQLHVDECLDMLRAIFGEMQKQLELMRKCHQQGIIFPYISVNFNWQEIFENAHTFIDELLLGDDATRRLSRSRSGLEFIPEAARADYQVATETMISDAVIKISPFDNLFEFVTTWDKHAQLFKFIDLFSEKLCEQKPFNQQQKLLRHCLSQIRTNLEEIQKGKCVEVQETLAGETALLQALNELMASINLICRGNGLSMHFMGIKTPEGDVEQQGPLHQIVSSYAILSESTRQYYQPHILVDGNSLFKVAPQILQLCVIDPTDDQQMKVRKKDNLDRLNRMLIEEYNKSSDQGLFVTRVEARVMEYSLEFNKPEQYANYKTQVEALAQIFRAKEDIAPRKPHSILNISVESLLKVDRRYQRWQCVEYLISNYALFTPEEFIKNPLFEKYAKDTGFRELDKDENLEKGDVLLMSILHPTLNHVAIFLGDMVLHHLADRLSCREPYSMWLQKCTGKRYRYAS